LNYNFYWDGQPYNRDDILIGTIFRDPWMKPALGQTIEIKGKRVKITRTDPNPTTDTAMVKYYVIPLSGNEPFKNRTFNRKDML